MIRNLHYAEFENGVVIACPVRRTFRKYVKMICLSDKTRVLRFWHNMEEWR